MKSRVRAVVLSLMFGLFSKGTVTAQVQARMMLSDTVICEGTQVTISDISTGAQSVSWYVNGTYKGGADNFEYTPNSSGTHTIRLIVSGTGGSRDTLTKYLRVHAMPYYNMNFDQGFGDITICKGTELTVSEWSTVRGVESVSWTFGDGTSSSVIYPRHTYSVAGAFTIEVRVYGFCGTQSFTRKVTVTDGMDAKPMVSISAPDQACPGEEFNVSVYDGSGFGSDSFHLFVNDLEKTYLEESKIRFDSPQTVKLRAIAFNQCGRDTITKEVLITDTADRYHYLYGYPNKVCPGQPVNIVFSSSAMGGIAHIDYGDGMIDTIVSDGSIYSYTNTHIYSSEDTFQVVVYLNPTCGKPDTLGYEIVVDGNTSPPYYGLFSPSNVCPGEMLSFYPPALTVGDTFFVDFGNGQTLTLVDTGRNLTMRYDVAGNYQIRTRLTNRCGNFTTSDFVFYVLNDAEIESRITVNYGNAALASCVNDTLEFNLEIQNMRIVNDIEWYFDDGYRVSGQRTVRRSFAATGNHFVKCVYRSACGLEYESGLYFDITDHTMAPKVSFWAFPPTGCVGDMVLIDNFTRNSDSMLINFGDGIIEEINPMDFHTFHVYEKPDYYQIRLTAVNGCGSDEKVQAYRAVSGPDVEIEFDKTAYVLGDTVRMNAIASSHRSLEWELPDGQKLAESSTKLIAEQEGSFTVRLSAIGFFGCETIVEREFRIGNSGFIPHYGLDKLRVYPNPTNGLLKIEIDPYNEFRRVMVMDGRGSLLFEKMPTGNVSESIVSIDLSSYELGSGMYFIRVETTEGIGVRRIVLK
ncbi:MAG: T9SS type A sorting domain-containing protein [Flavobacteriales bacterium]|nr:T9SS type A sorting domain-containing protein [Flavobacteriales bacterium]